MQFRSFHFINTFNLFQNFFETYRSFLKLTSRGTFEMKFIKIGGNLQYLSNYLQLSAPRILLHYIDQTTNPFVASQQVNNDFSSFGSGIIVFELSLLSVSLFEVKWKMLQLHQNLFLQLVVEGILISIFKKKGCNS